MTDLERLARLRTGIEAVLAMQGHWYLLPIGHPDAEERQMLAQSVVQRVLRTALEEAA